MFHAIILTSFPDLFPGPLAASLTGKALKKGLWSFECYNYKHFNANNGRIDDTPAGGGAGMVMRVDLVTQVIDTALALQEELAKRNPEDIPLIYFTPRGKPLTQAFIKNLAQGPAALFICGRFEGVDERLFTLRPVQEVSLGDFILAGGEIAAMACIEATVRLLPGVLGNAASLESESFDNNLLEYPHYTRPVEFEDEEIPPVLLSGHHQAIARWRLEESERITRERRPDLWEKYKEKSLE